MFTKGGSRFLYLRRMGNGQRMKMGMDKGIDRGTNKGMDRGMGRSIDGWRAIERNIN